MVSVLRLSLNIYVVKLFANKKLVFRNLFTCWLFLQDARFFFESFPTFPFLDICQKPTSRWDLYTRFIQEFNKYDIPKRYVINICLYLVCSSNRLFQANIYSPLQSMYVGWYFSVNCVFQCLRHSSSCFVLFVFFSYRLVFCGHDVFIPCTGTCRNKSGLIIKTALSC